MKQNVSLLKAMVFVCIGMMIFPGYAAAQDVYKGELLSGSAKVGNLSSNEIWLFHGEKGSRVVISTAVDQGKAPPEIYLYPPEDTEYEAHSGTISDRSQVLDHKLDSFGKYVVVIHPCDPQDKSSYQIAYTTLAPGDSYAIHPDDPNGKLISENPYKPESDRLFIDKSGGIAPASILFDLVTFGVGPILFTAFTGVDRAVGGAADINDRIEVASRNIEEPAGQCDTTITGIGSR